MFELTLKNHKFKTEIKQIYEFIEQAWNTAENTTHLTSLANGHKIDETTLPV